MSPKYVPIKTEPPAAKVNALLALYNGGHYVEGESGTRMLLEQYPDFRFGWKLLGGILEKQGKDALTAFKKIAELMPDDAEAHYNLGVALKKSGLLDNAAASYRRAIKIKPDYVEAHYNLGNTLRDMGRLDDAIASYHRALEIKPDSAHAHNNLGTTFTSLGQLNDAIASYRRAVALKPDFPLAYYNLGNAQKDLGQLGDAVTSYRRALELQPDFIEVHNNLGAALKQLGHLDAALTSYRRAVELKPGLAEAHNNLGVILLDLGQPDDAIASYHRALELKPDYAEAYSNLLFCLSHSETINPPALFAEHRRFAEQFEAPLRAAWPHHTNSRDSTRCLQVGFVSGDLRNHAVAHFIEAVLAHLAERPQLSLHAYYNHTLEDSTTQRLQKYFSYWNSIADLSDDALAKKICADGIDILIDLSGHTAKNRLLTFARKPAPVQVSWIGYPGTTGLSAMDYYQSDRFLFPDERFDGQFTEKIVRLPASSPFLPSSESPPVNILPALNNGYLTFGSFNRLNKISRSVIALWSQLLHALPKSKMLLGGMPPDGKYQILTEWFAQQGIAPDRLNFHGRGSMEHYLALHHQVDICLDTFPYNGGTTTFHALWMGVPTLTLTGDTMAGWAGASILGHVNLEKAFAAHKAEEFVARGSYWSGNLGALADIRSGLRERFAKSARGQPAVVAAGVESALRIMWQRWCAGLPAESFEVPWQDGSTAEHPLERSLP